MVKRGVGKELTNYPIISFKLHCFTAAGIAVAAGCGVDGDSDNDNDAKWLKKCEQNEKAHKTEYNENNNNNYNNNGSSTTTTMSQVWSSAWQRRRAEGGGSKGGCMNGSCKQI